jgi:hypothetical protein
MKVTYRTENVATKWPEPVTSEAEGKSAVGDSNDSQEHEQAQQSMQASDPPSEKDHPDPVASRLQST